MGRRGGSRDAGWRLLARPSPSAYRGQAWRPCDGDAKAAEQRFHGLRLRLARGGHSDNEAAGGSDDKAASGGFGGAQEGQNGAPENTRDSAGIFVQPCHLDQHRNDALKRDPIRFDCRASVHRRLLRVGRGGVWGRCAGTWIDWGKVSGPGEGDRLTFTIRVWIPGPHRVPG